VPPENLTIKLDQKYLQTLSELDDQHPKK